jgi:hypothetical protein
MRGTPGKNNRARNRGWLWLLLVPFVVLCWPPFYNVIEPDLFGIPFFYWYQFLWVFLTPALTWLVYVKTE